MPSKDRFVLLEIAEADYQERNDGDVGDVDDNN